MGFSLRLRPTYVKTEYMHHDLRGKVKAIHGLSENDLIIRIRRVEIAPNCLVRIALEPVSKAKKREVDDSPFSNESLSF
jgi:hypothetical protein